MFDVRVLKLFNANYGDKSNLGTTLNLAQNDCFGFEGWGTRINNKMYHRLQCTKSVQDNFPKLGLNTSEVDFCHAKYVIDCGCVTVRDYQSYLHNKE